MQWNLTEKTLDVILGPHKRYITNYNFVEKSQNSINITRVEFEPINSAFVYLDLMDLSSSFELPIKNINETIECKNTCYAKPECSYGYYSSKAKKCVLKERVDFHSTVPCPPGFLCFMVARKFEINLTFFI